MASLLPPLKFRPLDANGQIMPGGKVFTYDAGTTNPRTTYSDYAGTVVNTNPVILDGSGTANIWLVGLYKVLVTNAAGVQIDMQDNVSDIATQVGNAYGNIINIYGGTAAGTANVLTITPNPAMTSYVTGQKIRFIVFQNNTGGATLNANNLGDKAIRKLVNGVLTPLDVGDLKAGTVAEVSYDGTVFQLLNPPFASYAQGVLAGTALQPGGATKLVSNAAVLTTSGTSIDFNGIPAGAKRVTTNFSGISTNSTGIIGFQMGTAAAIETTGYLGAVANAGVNSTINFTSAFSIASTGAAAYLLHGSLIFTLLDSTTNLWVVQGAIGFSNQASLTTVSGSKALADVLTRMRLMTSTGTDVFDAGKANIMWEV